MPSFYSIRMRNPIFQSAPRTVTNWTVYFVVSLKEKCLTERKWCKVFNPSNRELSGRWIACPFFLAKMCGKIVHPCWNAFGEIGTAKKIRSFTHCTIWESICEWNASMITISNGNQEKNSLDISVSKVTRSLPKCKKRGQLIRGVQTNKDLSNLVQMKILMEYTPYFI